VTDASLPPSPLTWAYADDWTEEAPELAAARRRAAQLGTHAPSRAVGALLRSVAAATGARSVVEVGSGTGVTGGWILAGLGIEGTLTTVDPDSEMQTAARDTFASMGISHTRVRTIAGLPAQVLPRLSDTAYDIVVIGPGTAADGEAGHDLIAEAVRLLRPGGTVIVTPIFGDDGVLPGRHDLAQHLRDDPDWIAAVATVGEGVIIATRRIEDSPAED
jgi:predicted O-methyltransferase YrrM